jgi:hypothetical protein
LTSSYRAAAELVGCDHHTVRRYVEQRDSGRAVERMHAAQLIDPYLEKLEEWVDRSDGRIAADVVHGKLLAMGMPGRNAPPGVRLPRRRRRGELAIGGCSGRGSRSRGLWLQWDWGDGPRIGARLSLDRPDFRAAFILAAP